MPVDDVIQRIASIARITETNIYHLVLISLATLENDTDWSVR